MQQLQTILDYTIQQVLYLTSSDFLVNVWKRWHPETSFLYQKSEEDRATEKVKSQLDAIIALKDQANKDLRAELNALQNEMRELKMERDYLRNQWSVHV